MSGFDVVSCVDLRHLLVRYQAHEDKLGLEALAFMSLGVKLDKDWKLRAGDWEAETLSTRQLEYTANDALVTVNIACVNVSNHLTSAIVSWVRAVMWDQEQLLGEVVKVLEKDLDMLRADLRVCEENKKMIENEAVGMKRVEQQTVGLVKEKMNMKSRADLLSDKE